MANVIETSNNKELVDDYMLTTFDNPFNPFEDFENWFKRDMILGHNTCVLMSIYAGTSPLFSDEVNEKYIDEAVDSIISNDPSTFKKVWRADFK